MRDTHKLPLVIFALTWLSYLAPTAVWAHDELVEKEVTFSCPVADVAGVLMLPDRPDEHSKSADDSAPKSAPGKWPCVVIIGGTMSHTRDGAMVRDGMPPRDALLRLARALGEKGYASLRYDKVGYGGSKPTPKWTGSFHDEAVVAAAAIAFARERKDVGPVAVAGESAGAYLACLAAKDGVAADAYIFLGAHCGPGEAIYEYNFAPLARYAETSAERREWVHKNLQFELALGKHYKEMFAAAARGDEKFELADDDFRRTVDLKRRQEELHMPPDETFRYIQAPALALAGGKDLNVPPSHAARAVAIMRQAGNHATTCVVLDGADHSFQIAPDDEDLRFRERYSFESFRRQYDPRLYEEVAAWLDKQLAKQ